MGAFSDLFARLDPDPRVRGKQFEHICKWFLTNDPVYKHELRRVWLWDEWPGRWGGDAGIDLVAEDRDGTALGDPGQGVRPRLPSHQARRGQVPRRVGARGVHLPPADRHDQPASTASASARSRTRRSGSPSSGSTTSRPPTWTGPRHRLHCARRGRPNRPAPHDYQREAINDVVKGFATADRGQLIMACGTGKTLTALFITEKLAAERTLVLVPSLSLLKQTHAGVASQLQRAEFDSLPVCSDETVARADDDAAVAHTSDLGVPVTTDPAEIAAFLRRRSGPRVVFATYQSSPQIAEAFALGRVPGVRPGRSPTRRTAVAGPVSSDFATVLDADGDQGASGGCS